MREGQGAPRVRLPAHTPTGPGPEDSPSSRDPRSTKTQRRRERRRRALSPRVSALSFRELLPRPVRTRRPWAPSCLASESRGFCSLSCLHSLRRLLTVLVQQCDRSEVNHQDSEVSQGTGPGHVHAEGALLTTCVCVCGERVLCSRPRAPVFTPKATQLPACPAEAKLQMRGPREPPAAPAPCSHTSSQRQGCVRSRCSPRGPKAVRTPGCQRPCHPVCLPAHVTQAVRTLSKQSDSNGHVCAR